MDTASRLNKQERKVLRKQQRPAFILAFALFTGVTGFNLVFYFHDIILGIEDLPRPPLSQLIIVEVAAVAVAFISYYFPSRKLLKDLSVGLKKKEEHSVVRKYVKNNSGAPEFTVLLANSLTVLVTPELFKSLKVGDVLEVEYVPESTHVFAVNKVDCGGCAA